MTNTKPIYFEELVPHWGTKVVVWRERGWWNFLEPVEYLEPDTGRWSFPRDTKHYMIKEDAIELITLNQERSS